ncbi:glutathione S-transferase [Ghiorsea bivora]|uniref:glutathione S-transferase n=1 Tax=Ghiorsea bivora TaxID=1485545 RepID=UPI00056EBB90|nr:glutathione S-transferase [Ghiorsea bivora]
MKPILYSFRRCPYAMRARFALIYAGIQLEHREIALKNKPQALLDISPKATVPVLQLGYHQIIDESLDIMLWSLQQHDPQGWLKHQAEALSLIKNNDNVFKPWLDKYKYADRFPEFPQDFYRSQAELFLQKLEKQLREFTFLFAEHATLADFAIFPFVRQFAFVDKTWFDIAPYPKLQIWLNTHLESPLFEKVMQKHLLWHP